MTTILWGNVGINVLLTLLSDSIMAGVTAFLFSTFAITLFGEIAPQAYFSRNALKMASLLSPVLRFYQMLLYPLVKSSALMLDAWLGKEAVHYFREADLKEILRRHMLAEESEVNRIEAIGALNFLTIDDLPIESEGVVLDPRSILRLPTRGGMPVFPSFSDSPDDLFLRQVEASDKAWVVIADESGQPLLIMDADRFLRHALLAPAHRPPRLLPSPDRHPRPRHTAGRGHSQIALRRGCLGGQRHQLRCNPALDRHTAADYRLRPVGPAAPWHCAARTAECPPGSPSAA